MSLSVTVLGASPAWANPGGACAGYIVEDGTANVLVECGFGIVSRLRERLAFDELGAVVVSHLHADHFMDLVPMRYGLKYGRLRSDPRLPLYAPPGAIEFLASLGRALDGDPHFFDGTFRITEYQPGQRLEIAGLGFTFTQVKHYVPSYAMAIANGRTLVYSADAAPCAALLQLAHEADLFLCEAAIDSLEDDDPNMENRGHMTASEAAELARRAGAARLLLTHYRSASATESALTQARKIFAGPVEYAREGHTYSV